MLWRYGHVLLSDKNKLVLQRKNGLLYDIDPMDTLEINKNGEYFPVSLKEILSSKTTFESFIGVEIRIRAQSGIVKFKSQEEINKERNKQFYQICSEMKRNLEEYKKSVEDILKNKTK
ncbi:hypothetical protein [Fictibacillus sp. 18YEL24]|uniref:hypothetical protein n=1 Tax=Fictibacillus sp. 18YEL24 TaxID=2745875 RepID=UPI0018CCB004|nr:hypothetical protein [Fictibacillus sp. 18YEL24]MBH0169305.1 hypothetical protein [Fictibacillus sp. 18YEL24]